MNTTAYVSGQFFSKNDVTIKRTPSRKIPAIKIKATSKLERTKVSPYASESLYEIVKEYGITKTFEVISMAYDKDKIGDAMYLELLNALRLIIEYHHQEENGVIYITRNVATYKSILKALG